MAKILEEYVAIKISKIAKDDDNTELNVFDDEMANTLADAVDQILKSTGVQGCIVEVVKS